MERIGVRELRQHASRYLQLVRSGETVEVTQRGRLVARLVPAAPDTDHEDLARLVGEGLLTPPTQPFRLPTPHQPEGATARAGEDLEALREERL